MKKIIIWLIVVLSMTSIAMAADYASVVDNALAFWSYDLNATYAVDDLAQFPANTHGLDAIGEYQFVPGINGSAINFTGDYTSYAQTNYLEENADFSLLPDSGSFAVCTWVKAEALSTGIDDNLEVFFTAGDNSCGGGVNNLCMSFQQMNAEPFTLNIYQYNEAGDTATMSYFKTEFYLNNWYHVCYIRNEESDVLTVCVNNTINYTASGMDLATEGIYDTEHVFRLGNHNPVAGASYQARDLLFDDTGIWIVEEPMELTGTNVGDACGGWVEALYSVGIGAPAPPSPVPFEIFQEDWETNIINTTKWFVPSGSPSLVSNPALNTISIQLNGGNNEQIRNATPILNSTWNYANITFWVQANTPTPNEGMQNIICDPFFNTQNEYPNSHEWGYITSAPAWTTTGVSSNSGFANVDNVWAELSFYYDAAGQTIDWFINGDFVVRRTGVTECSILQLNDADIAGDAYYDNIKVTEWDGVVPANRTIPITAPYQPSIYVQQNDYVLFNAIQISADGTGSYAAASYITLDISGLGVNNTATIDNAILRMYQNGTEATYYVSVYLVNDTTPSYDFTTWAGQPCGDVTSSIAAACGQPVDNVSLGLFYENIYWNVTSAVQSAVNNGYVNMTLLIKADYSGTALYKQFATFTDITNKPILQDFVYHYAAPEPPAPPSNETSPYTPTGNIIMDTVVYGQGDNPKRLITLIISIGVIFWAGASVWNYAKKGGKERLG